MSLSKVEKLVIEVKRILKQAIDLGGSTLRDYSNAMGENGYFQQTLLLMVEQVKCVSTAKPHGKLKVGQRASVFCPTMPTFK